MLDAVQAARWRGLKRGRAGMRGPYPLPLGGARLRSTAP